MPHASDRPDSDMTKNNNIQFSQGLVLPDALLTITPKYGNSCDRQTNAVNNY